MDVPLWKWLPHQLSFSKFHEVLLTVIFWANINFVWSSLWGVSQIIPSKMVMDYRLSEYLFDDKKNLLIWYHFWFQTPHGLLVLEMKYDQQFFEEKLKMVVKNYKEQYLVEYFEQRTPRRLEKLTVN